MISYATAQAAKDLRIQGDVHFHGFSIILSPLDHTDQPTHIDCVAPNFQFGLMLSESAPWTVCAPGGNLGPHTAAEFVAHFSTEPMVLLVGDNPPDTLCDTLEDNPEASKLLQVVERKRECECGDIWSLTQIHAPTQDFGDLFLHPTAIESVMEKAFVEQPTGSRGEVCSLPGGVLHHGPRGETSRAVMFFAASGSPSASESYDSVSYSHSDPFHPDAHLPPSCPACEPSQ